MFDVLIVGAGPAGSIAALAAARAGARVLVIDREAFPRDKLCGDTVNPGALAILRRLGVVRPIEDRGLRVEGMRVTGERGMTIDARYPGGLCGRALRRRDLDAALLNAAMASGAQFEPGVAAERAIVDDERGEVRVVGVLVRQAQVRRELRAPIVIAADGRRSVIAFGLGLARHPERPRRWAIGTYYTGVTGLSPMGEMHVRSGRYIGVAAVPDGLVNVCIVRPGAEGHPAFRDPAALVAAEIARDRLLAPRFAAAQPVMRPMVLGPLAVDRVGGSFDGLLVAGDAAGFVDPMTGDGLRFAFRGGELAAVAALDALAHGWAGVHARLAAARRAAFARKWRFNRALRGLVAEPRAVEAAALAAQVAPFIVRRIVSYAGDCGAAG